MQISGQGVDSCCPWTNNTCVCLIRVASMGKGRSSRAHQLSPEMLLRIDGYWSMGGTSILFVKLLKVCIFNF